MCLTVQIHTDAALAALAALRDTYIHTDAALTALHDTYIHTESTPAAATPPGVATPAVAL